MTDTLTGQKMAKTNVLAIASPGSRALKNAKYERYCRLRASAQPRIPAYREVGWHSKRDDDAYANACRLERRSEIRDRISYLTRQAEELIAEKRQRIEERLWAIHEANIQDYPLCTISGHCGARLACPLSAKFRLRSPYERPALRKSFAAFEAAWNVA